VERRRRINGIVPFVWGGGVFSVGVIISAIIATYRYDPGMLTYIPPLEFRLNVFLVCVATSLLSAIGVFLLVNHILNKKKLSTISEQKEEKI